MKAAMVLLVCSVGIAVAAAHEPGERPVTTDVRDPHAWHPDRLLFDQTVTDREQTLGFGAIRSPARPTFFFDPMTDDDLRRAEERLSEIEREISRLRLESIHIRQRLRELGQPASTPTDPDEPQSSTWRYQDGAWYVTPRVDPATGEVIYESSRRTDETEPSDDADPELARALENLHEYAESGEMQQLTDQHRRALEFLRADPAGRGSPEFGFGVTEGGPVIRRYLCDEHGVIGHDVIYRWPEIHPKPGQPYRAGVVDIGPDVGVTPEADDD